MNLGTAAAMAGIAGIGSIIGRLAMGVLLDLFPARPLGVTMFLLPVGAALMLTTVGGSVPMAPDAPVAQES